MDKLLGIALFPALILVVIYAMFIGEEKQAKEIWNGYKQLFK